MSLSKITEGRYFPYWEENIWFQLVFHDELNRQLCFQHVDSNGNAQTCPLREVMPWNSHSILLHLRHCSFFTWEEHLVIWY